MFIHDPVDYQATDLARKPREVIDAARSGAAYIRDKDGLRLVLAPAAELERTTEMLGLAVDVIRALDALDHRADPGPGAYGGLAWLSLLPEEAQRRCVAELIRVLLVSASGTSLRPVEQLLGDWRATAEAWANPDTRDVLLADETSPLIDVEL